MVDPPLVRICDPGGRPRGVGFAADDRGTVVTGHEVVSGLERLLVRAPGGASRVLGPESIVELPEAALALLRTEGLGVTPLPVAAAPTTEPGAYVRIPAGGWREARVLGHSPVSYVTEGGRHLLHGALELAVGTAGADALRPGGGAAGGPVLDARTGSVVAVLGTALRAGHRAAGFAVPLRAAAGGRGGRGPLAELLARNAATVPAYGPDLNLGGVLQLGGISVGSDGPGDAGAEPVERPDVVRELAAFTARADGEARVLALVGEPGSGRTTELAAFAARRAEGDGAAPTVWLRGADLSADDASVAQAVGRTLARAARIVAASREDAGGVGDVSAERIAEVARVAGRPLVLLLDGPEEMPPVLAHRLDAWSRGTERWLAACGVRLVVACRSEYWEQAGALFGPGVTYGRGAPPCVRVGDLAGEAARRARERFGVPEGALAEREAGHPLSLRLLSEVRAALPGGVAGCPDRDEIFGAYLDLMCLRVAVRLAAPAGVRGSGVRRLAARVAGQVHEAARRSLGPGQGELDREAFEELFPWGTRFGVSGWASAVLAEGLLVPAGEGYRFGHEEVADWIQGMHLDVDGALDSLVFRRRPDTFPVPRHRAGPVVRALLFLDEVERGERLRELVGWVAPDVGSGCAGGGVDGDGRGVGGGGAAGERGRSPEAEEAAWWGAVLVRGALGKVGDAAAYLDVVRVLAERGCFDGEFWMRLAVDDDTRFELLRHRVVRDGAEAGDRCLDTVAACLATEPRRVHRRLTRWFDDDRPLPALPDATVAEVAQALLHTHRHGDIDDLVEALVERAHPRAEELLVTLADEEPAALCRAVARWAHDGRPARHAAAATYGTLVAPKAVAPADREALRHAAYALLDGPDRALHGAALAVLVQDPGERPAYLAAALDRFAAGDARVPAHVLAQAAATHPEPVFAAFRARLRQPGPGLGELLRTLAALSDPAHARRAAELVRELAEDWPDAAASHVAAFVDRCLEHGPGARPVLFPLVVGLVAERPPVVRAALAPVLAAPGTTASRALRAELLDVLLEEERELDVLDALLCAAARDAAGRGRPRTRDLVHRTATLLVRTPEGAARFDGRLVDLARTVPGFAALVAGWLGEAPREWAALVGPASRRTIENVAGARVPA